MLDRIQLEATFADPAGLDFVLGTLRRGDFKLGFTMPPNCRSSNRQLEDQMA